MEREKEQAATATDGSIHKSVLMFYELKGRKIIHGLLLSGLHPGEDVEKLAQRIIFQHPRMKMSYKVLHNGNDKRSESGTMTGEGEKVTPNQ